MSPIRVLPASHHPPLSHSTPEALLLPSPLQSRGLPAAAGAGPSWEEQVPLNNRAHPSR